MFTKKHIVLTAVISIIISAIVAFLGTYFYFTFVKYDVVSRARDIITENYVDPISDKKIDTMNDYAISAMVGSLKDPYSYYFNAEDFSQYEENTKEEYIGIGVTVNADSETGNIVVVAPTDNSPAQKAGILPGDIIKKVDNLVAKSDNYDDVVNHIKGDGKEGTSVKIYIERNGEEKVFDVKREVIPITTVSYKMIDDNVCYIRISEFKHNTVDEFSEGIKFLRKNQAKGLVIDLRSNPGGYADSVIKITDKLLPEGTIAYLEDNAGRKEYFYSDKDALNIPMTVLVNGGTASASELLAGSTQAHKVAKIIGTKTYGKAVGQMPYMLTKDTAIYLTNARYYTPRGECIDKKGIIPDIEIEMDEELKSQITSLDISLDTQLKTAVEVLYDDIK